MRTLDRKAAIVTGGSGGIGRAIVLRPGRGRHDCPVTYHQDETAAKQVVAETDGRAVRVRADLGITAEVRRLFEAAEEHLDGLEILVNNAGTANPQLIADTTEDEYDRIMAVNAKGTFLAIHNAAHRMRDGGRIINISTINTVLAGPGIAVYAASKAAVEQFTRVAARELGARGITVNTVSPGATDTDLLRGTNTEEGLRVTPPPG
jgi:3-oxoacyl-[acyl-carrier protein] reductase